MKWPTLRPIQDQAEMARLVDWCNPGQPMPGATHVFEKDGEPLAVVGLGSIVTFTAATRPGAMTGRDSIHLLNLVENIVRNTLGPGKIIGGPITPGCPLEKYAEVFGAINHGPCAGYVTKAIP